MLNKLTERITEAIMVAVLIVLCVALITNYLTIKNTKKPISDDMYFELQCEIKDSNTGEYTCKLSRG